MAVFVYLNIQDGDGEASTVEFAFPDATPVGVLAAAVPAIAALVNPLTLGGLRSAGFRVEVDVSGSWGPVSALLADVQEKAMFVFRGVNNFIKRLGIPAFDESLFMNGGSSPTVNTADTDVAAFVDFMTDGITVSATLITPTDIRGDDIVSLESASQSWGRNRSR